MDLEQWVEGGRRAVTLNRSEEGWSIFNYHLIWGIVKTEVLKDIARKVVDWEKLKDITKEVKERGVEEEHNRYKNLSGKSYYDKMVSLRA